MEEMSISTPLALVATICVMRSSCSVVASLSSTSTWTVTKRLLPSFRIGIRSMGES
jgi:hypothetical protein